MDASRQPFQGSRTELCCVSVQIFEFPGGKKVNARRREAVWADRFKVYGTGCTVIFC